MTYYTITLRHIATGREVEFTSLADNAREALSTAYEEYDKKEYSYVSFTVGKPFN